MERRKHNFGVVRYFSANLYCAVCHKPEFSSTALPEPQAHMNMKGVCNLAHMCFLFTGKRNDALSWLGRHRWSVSILVLHIHADNIMVWLQHYPRLFSTIMHLMWVNNISCDFTGFMNRMKFHTLPVYGIPIIMICILVITMWKKY